MASTTSKIEISGLGRETIESLKSHAKARGLSVEGYVKELIEAEMSVREMARRNAVDEVFAPVQKQFQESGMSEAELDRLVDAARTEHHNKVTKNKKR